MKRSEAASRWESAGSGPLISDPRSPPALAFSPRSPPASRDHPGRPACPPSSATISASLGSNFQRHCWAGLAPPVDFLPRGPRLTLVRWAGSGGGRVRRPSRRGKAVGRAFLVEEKWPVRQGTPSPFQGPATGGRGMN